MGIYWLRCRRMSFIGLRNFPDVRFDHQALSSESHKFIRLTGGQKEPFDRNSPWLSKPFRVAGVICLGLVKRQPRAGCLPRLLHKWLRTHRTSCLEWTDEIRSWGAMSYARNMQFIWIIRAMGVYPLWSSAFVILVLWPFSKSNVPQLLAGVREWRLFRTNEASKGWSGMALEPFEVSWKSRVPASGGGGDRVNVPRVLPPSTDHFFRWSEDRRVRSVWKMCKGAWKISGELLP